MKTPRIGRGTSKALALTVMGFLFGACSPGDPTPKHPDPFPGSASSLRDLGAATLAAFPREDREALEAFRLTEQEHNDVVWPELPASAPEVNFPVDFAWQNIQLRNHRAYSRQFNRFRGQRLTFRGLECRGAPERFETFIVLTDCWVQFEGSGEGRAEVQLFKDVLFRNGGFKVFRYYDEGPRRVDARTDYSGVPGRA